MEGWAQRDPGSSAVCAQRRAHRFLQVAPVVLEQEARQTRACCGALAWQAGCNPVAPSCKVRLKSIGGPPSISRRPEARWSALEPSDSPLRREQHAAAPSRPGWPRRAAGVPASVAAVVGRCGGGGCARDSEGPGEDGAARRHRPVTLPPLATRLPQAAPRRRRWTLRRWTRWSTPRPAHVFTCFRAAPARR